MRKHLVTHKQYQEADLTSLSLYKSLFSLQTLTETKVPNPVEGH